MYIFTLNERMSLSSSRVQLDSPYSESGTVNYICSPGSYVVQVNTNGIVCSNSTSFTTLGMISSPNIAPLNTLGYNEVCILADVSFIVTNGNTDQFGTWYSPYSFSIDCGSLIIVGFLNFGGTSSSVNCGNPLHNGMTLQ
jgi:hypothetical protein